MKRSAKKVLRFLAGSEDIDAIPGDQLLRLADENPYFPIAQFLLAKKLQVDRNDHFLQQAQKTALYFSNPYWLQYQLTDEFREDGFPASTDDDQTDTSGETHPATTEFFNGADSKDEIFRRDNFDQVVLETQTPAALEATEVLEELAGVSREINETTEDFVKEAQAPLEVRTELPLTKASLPLKFTNDGIEDAKAEPDEHERMFQNIKAMLDATNEEADADVEGAVVPIDPYYTIDYFASQGIKLEFEPNPKDELSQHLKKFTQWLKHMKKLGPEDATEVIIRSDTEADIQKSAESSNTVREVVTEAMASVLEKQGKNDKAIELYKKLSFLNRDKSTYFAAKIKNLKGI